MAILDVLPAPTPLAGEASPSPASRTRHLRVAAAVAVVVAVAVLGLMNWAAIGSGTATLAGGDGEWLSFALVLIAGLWIAGTAAQLGAVPIRPPLRQLFAVQVAAGLVNHVVPGGVGGMAVNARYLQRSGMSRSAAVAAVGVNSVATFVTHLALIAALWSLAPTALTARSSSGGFGGVVHRLLPGSSILAEVAAAVAIIIVSGAAAAGPTRRRSAIQWLRRAIDRGSAHVRREVRDSGRVLLHPGRAALLWLGSAAGPVVHALILVAVYNALSGGLSVLVVALVYLVASSVAALVPSPGGFGALDVTLVAGLVAVGAPTTVAVAAVLGYRLITVWLPLVPGVLVFAALLRRRVL